MRMIILSALFALGVGIAGTTAASAAPINGLSKALAATSVIEDAQYYRRDRRWRGPRCRTVRVCRRTPYGRRCHYERICYRR